MTVREAVKAIDGTFFCGAEAGDVIVNSACGADLMSDVMAFVKEQVVLLTGLVNAQVLRTAELMDIKVIVFVRGKHPTADMVDMAKDLEIALIGTRLSMFLACGRLYEAGLRNSGTRPI
ncbi:MAG: hypothetical protein WCT14_08600 [Treponemataceae bacterium]